MFTSWGKETPHKYTEDELNHALTALGDPSLGTVLRAKGIVPAADGGAWLHFDYVPGAPEIRRGAADYTGFTALCIGQQTAQAARKHNMNVKIAENATIDAMIACLLEES